MFSLSPSVIQKFSGGNAVLTFSTCFHDYVFEKRLYLNYNTLHVSSYHLELFFLYLPEVLLILNPCLELSLLLGDSMYEHIYSPGWCAVKRFKKHVNVCTSAHYQPVRCFKPTIWEQQVVIRFLYRSLWHLCTHMVHALACMHFFLNIPITFTHTWTAMFTLVNLSLCNR